MSDFLASLRNVARNVLSDDTYAKEVTEANNRIRQSPEYRDEVRRFSGQDVQSPEISADPQLDAFRRGRAANLLASDLEDNRERTDIVRDTGLDIASGFAGGALNLLALGASGITAQNRMINPGAPDPGVAIGQFADATTNFLGGLKTQDNQDAGAVYAVSQDELMAQNRHQQLAAEANGANQLVAGTQRFFGDVADTVSNLRNQPRAVGAGIGQGIGSLLLGGPVAKGTTSFVSVGARALAERGLMSPRLATVVAESVEHAAMTGAITVMESGGAYTQASNQVMAMSHEDLLVGSPEYARLIQDGLSQARAKNIVASKAGAVAASLQAPVAAVTGRLVAPFEAAPLAGRTVRGALQNIGKETIEEGVQSFSGGLSSNVGVRLAADRNLDVAEGLGQGLAEGAIFGAGTAGVFAGPNVAVGAVERGVAGAKKLASTIYERGKAFNESNVITPEVTTAAVREVTRPTEPVKPDESIDPAADMAELERLNDRLTPLGQQFAFDRETFEPQSDIEAQLVAALPAEDVDIWDVMQMASNGINSNNTTPEQKTDLAILIDRLEGQVTSDALAEVDRLKDEVTPGGTVAQELTRIVRAQESVANNKYMQKAQRSALKSAPEITAEAVEDVSTPEGRKAARQAALQAILTPENIRPEVVERLLKHSTTQLDLFTKQQLNALRATAALTSTVREMEADALKMKAKLPALAEVANQAQMYDAKKEGAAGKSVRGHYDAIQRLVNLGATEEASGAMESFKNFAQSMANKLEAINKSHESRVNKRNTPQKFEAYSQNNGWHTNSVNVISQDAGSIAFAQQASVDARYVVDSYNKLAEQFPELGMQKIERQDIHPDFTAGPAKFVASQTAIRDRTEVENRVEQTQQKQPEPKTEQAPEAKAEPVVEPEPSSKVVEQAPELDRPYSSEKIKKAPDSVLAERATQIEGRIAFDEALPNDAANLERIYNEQKRRAAAVTEAEVEQPTEQSAPAPVEAVEEVAEPKAEPEVQATEETAETQQTPKDVFPNLVQDENGDQLLHNGFNLDTSNTNLMTYSEADIIGALQSADALKELTGLAKSKLAPPVSGAYIATVEAVLDKVWPRMKSRLASSKHFKPYQNGKPIKNAIRRADLRLLNILTRDANGKLGIDPTVGKAMTYALVDWLAQNSVSPTTRTEDDIARKLGIDVTEVTPQLIKAYNSSITAQQAHDSLAQTIGQFLGLKPKSDVKNGLTDGLLLSIAAELLDSAELSGLIETTKPIEIGDRFVVFMKTNKQGLGLKRMEDGGPAFAGQTTLISQMMLKDSAVAGYTLSPEGPSGNRIAKLQGGGAPTTEPQNRAAKAENAVPQTVNIPILEHFRRLGREGVLALFANGELPDTMNIYDKEAKEGQNLAFLSAYDTAMGLVMEMEAEAKNGNISLEEVQLFREYAFSSVNRMQQQGQFGDQASKFTRELITPYGVTLDMTDPSELSIWRRGIAQALGIKIEKLRPEKWNEQLDAKLADVTIKEAIAALSDNAMSPDKLVQIMKDANISKPVEFHALVSVAEYQNASNLEEFFTHMYVEADGVTDGPTNSLLYMTKGGFTAEMIRGLRRGGLVFGKKPTALHEIFDPENGTGEVDTYQTGANRLKASLLNHINNVVSSGKGARTQAELRSHGDALLSLMNTLLGGQDFAYDKDTGELTIGRKQLKNPLTVTVYGSSPAGIAAKIAKEMTRVLYSEFSEASAASKENKDPQWGKFMFNDPAAAQQFFADLKTVASNQIVEYTDKEDRVKRRFIDKKNSVYVLENTNDITKTRINKRAVANLAKALEVFYVAPMVEAINVGMGSSVAGSQLIQSATNTMSAMAKAAFTNRIKAELEREVAAGGSMADGLSPDAMKKILSRVSFLFPYMEDDSITVNVKGLKKAFMDDAPDEAKESAVRPSATFADRVHTKLTVPMPAIAGVAGAAYVNISYGDGRMIIEASKNLTGGRLMVFDGINLALKDAIKNGKAINASVLSAIQTGTPFKDLEINFRNMVETIDLDQFSEEELKSIFENITPPKSRPESSYKNYVAGQLKGLASDLADAVLDETARQQVLAEVHISSDHMAALGAPASTEADANRVDLGDMTPEEQAEYLQGLYTKKRSALDEAKARVARPSEDLSSALDALPADASGVRATDTSRLKGLIGSLNIPSNQKGLIDRALSALNGKKWRVVFGSQDQANAYAEANGIPFVFQDGDMGLADPNSKTILITNLSSETLAHELIHAATIDRVRAYYDNDPALDPVSRNAVKRLDDLMIEWLETAVEAAELRTDDIRQSVYTATRTVVELINKGHKAEALNEFMAWNLANESLNKFNSTNKVITRLVRISNKVKEVLRKMFNLPGTDMASNIKFNTMILMRPGIPTLQGSVANQMLKQSVNFRPDLKDLMTRMAGIVATADQNFAKQLGPKPSEFALGKGYQLAQVVKNNGFNMTNEETDAFALMVAAFRADRFKNSKEQIQFDAFMREMQTQLNQSAMMSDPDSQDPNDQNLASTRINLLNGTVELGTDIAGRSMMVPMFVALAATNAEAQSLFNRIKVRNPKVAPKGSTFDEILKREATGVTNSLMAMNYGLKPNQKVGEEVAKIVAELVQKQDRDKSVLVQYLEAPSNLTRNLNEKITDFSADVIDKANEGMDYLTEQVRGTKLEGFATTANKVAQTTLGIMSKRLVADSTSKLTTIMNSTNMHQELRAFFNDLMGVNEDNVDVLQLVKIARATIHRVRQTYRKLLPQQISDQFSRKLTAQEWTDLHTGLGKTDLAVMLDNGLTTAAAIDLVSDPAAVTRLRDQKEADIKRMFSNSAEILKEAADLANLMMVGYPAHGLVKRNALAIANRAGSAKVGSFDLNSAEVKAVDAYVSLLAMSNLDPKVKQSLSALSATERDGMSFTLAQIAHARKTETDRIPDRLRFNVFKGYMPSERKGSFKAVPASQVNDYTKTGYRIVGSRDKQAVESLYDSRSSDYVYVATDLSAPAFKQGIMQTVRSTIFGLDATTGLQHDNPTAGMISDPKVVAQMAAAMSKNQSLEGVAPLFDEHGKLYAFERLVHPKDVSSAIETQSNAAVSLGQWMGRQHEEYQADVLNEVLIDRLSDMWSAANRQSKQNEFVDLYELAENDPVVNDALMLINSRDKERLKAKMGDKFMVRKDMYEQVIGYRSISIGDLWTGNTRVSKEHRDAIANYLTGLFGPETYRRLTVAEQAWSNLMGDARVAIVVKSVLVPVINGAANFYQLMANGIGPIDIAKMSAEKLKETHLYAQNHLKYQELENHLAAAKGAKRPDRVRQIETEMRKIEDLNSRLSIWPLIQAGEFTQVTEGLTQDDMELTQGRIWDYVSKAADKLPPAVKTAGRYAIVAKDTALFEGLARTVSYTDFVAKAVLYDHLINKTKLSKEQAYLRITNEFVNYDLLGGRMRSKAEDMGLIWFWAFKLRSIKVAVSMVRNNPLHALLTGFVPGVESVGTVIDDNMISLMGDGRWDNSLGPQNAFRALALNPVGQLIG